MRLYDYSKINKKTLNAVKAHIEKVGVEEIKPEVLANKSKAAAQMGAWVMDWVKAAESSI